ncbi:MAG: polyphosphate polymerase domain-containing protein [Bacteroidetes bacterium]|nr:polyphosphate polymerase domain-containing protein [Bacteroidota bacterium]
MVDYLSNIEAFDPISLKGMDKVKLMDRRDTKFIFTGSQFSTVLEKLRSNYSILEIKENKIQSYESIYFDTAGFKFYMDHHNGKLNRHKVRFRKYVESELHFLEVKFKSNKGRTRKRRSEISAEEFDMAELSKVHDKFIGKRLGYKPDQLKPSLKVAFSRLTLVHKYLNERVTLDFNLVHSKDEKEKKWDRLVIAEVKQDVLARSSDFISVMNEQRIFEISFSKYCCGINSIYPEVKFNRFKPRLMQLNKIVYGKTELAYA